MKTILSYIHLKQFSGQSAATLQMKKFINDHQDMLLYTWYNRGNPITFLQWIYNSFREFWIKKDELIRPHNLYINLGQSYFSFFRAFWWIIATSDIRKTKNFIIALNGNSFTEWSESGIKFWIFKNILKKADNVIVQGIRHKEILNKHHLNNIAVISNIPDNKGKSLEDVQERIWDSEEINILYLSLLVESKGWIELLESVEFISTKKKINIKICGPVSKTTFCKRFSSEAEIENFIDIKIAQNTNPLISIERIKSAAGEYKDHLFNEADIFILPTYFPNETQPLALLEAANSGCAIITTKAGEIPNTFSDTEVLFLDEITPNSIGNTISDLISEPLKMSGLSVSAKKRQMSDYSEDKYRSDWLELLAK